MIKRLVQPLAALLLTIATAPVMLAAAEEHADVSMIEVEGEGTRYWSRGVETRRRSFGTIASF